jgi:hypothetical protein
MTQTLPEILKERGERYGTFSMNATLSQSLKNTMAGHDNWHLLAPHHKEALHMIVHKIARILNGDPNYADSWHDIAGFAMLAAEGCTDAPTLTKDVWQRTETGWFNQSLKERLDKV